MPVARWVPVAGPGRRHRAGGARRGDAADLRPDAARPDDGRRHPRRDGRLAGPPPPRRAGLEGAAAEQPRSGDDGRPLRHAGAGRARSADRRQRRRPPRRAGGAGGALRAPRAAPARRARRAAPRAPRRARRPLRRLGRPPRARRRGRPRSLVLGGRRVGVVGRGRRGRRRRRPPGPAASPRSSALATTVAECVDVAADLAREHEPVGLELSVEDAERFLEQAPAELAARGIELVGPERLVRAGVRVSGRATPHDAADHPKRFGREAVVAWKLVVADDDGPASISDAELERAERAGATLLHSGRRWVRIDPAAMRRARKLLEEQVREHAVVDAVTLLKLAGEGVLDVGAAPSAPDPAAPVAWTDALLAGLPDERLQEEHEPAGFAGELRPYQRRGLAWLRFLERLGLGGCLADDMGLGKTATTLAYLLDRPGPHLVICPLSVVHNWQAEATRFAPALRVVVHHGAERAEEELAGADLVVTTYGLLPRDIEHLGAVEWSTVIADEAQLIKNPATHAAKALRALTRRPEARPHRHARREPARRPVGHPRRRQPRDARQPRAVPPPLRQADRARRRRRRRGPAAAHHAAVRAAPHEGRPLARPRPAGQDRAGRLGRPHPRAGRAVPARRRPAARRCRGDDRDEAPRPRARRAHAAQADLQPPGPRARRRLAPRRPLRASWPASTSSSTSCSTSASGRSCSPSSGRWASCSCATSPSASSCACRSCTAACRRPAATRWSPTSRPALGPPLLLVSLKAGGTGLNLTAASQVIHYDRWWNPAVEDQATDRAWRIGQGRTVNVHKLVCEGTVEERIAALIDQKRALADAVVGQRRVVAVRALDGRAARPRAAGDARHDQRRAAASARTRRGGCRRRCCAPWRPSCPTRPVLAGEGVRPRRRGHRHRDRTGPGPRPRAGLALRAVRGHHPHRAGRATARACSG